MDMSNAIEVGYEIKRRLKLKNLFQSDAAAALNMSAATFNNYCAGKREASYQSLCAIARFLDCTPNDLLGFPSAVDRGLYNDILAKVLRFLADHKRELPADRIGDLCWSIYDTAAAEPDLLIDADGRIREAILLGMMRSALSL